VNWRCLFAHDYGPAGILISPDGVIYRVSLCRRCSRCVSTETIDLVALADKSMDSTDWGPVKGSA